MVNAANSGLIRQMRPLVLLAVPLSLLAVPLSLACSGISPKNTEVEPPPGAPEVSVPPVAPSPVEAAPSPVATQPAASSLAAIAEQLVTAECAPPPFTDEEPKTPAPGRHAEVEAFLAKNPDAVGLVAVLVDALEAGLGPLEAAYPTVVGELLAEPVELTVLGANYEGVVVLNWARNTSDDWAWFSNQIVLSLDAAGVPNVNASPYQRKVRVLRSGAPPEVIDLTALTGLPAVGYAVIQAGKPPVLVEHSMPEDVIREMNEALGKSMALAPQP